MKRNDDKCSRQKEERKTTPLSSLHTSSGGVLHAEARTERVTARTHDSARVRSGQTAALGHTPARINPLYTGYGSHANHTRRGFIHRTFRSGHRGAPPHSSRRLSCHSEGGCRINHVKWDPQLKVQRPQRQRPSLRPRESRAPWRAAEHALRGQPSGSGHLPCPFARGPYSSRL